MAEAIKKYSHILNGKIVTLEEEYELLFKFYKMILESVCYPATDECIQNIVNDFLYNDSKYLLYEDVIEELEQLSKEYTLIILSDNWPCLYNYAKKKNIDEFFKKIYVSSEYGELKIDGLFFNHPKEDFNIKPGEEIFIDDNEKNLDVAVTRGFDVKLMDREMKVKDSKYEVIHNLSEIV